MEKDLLNAGLVAAIGAGIVTYFGLDAGTYLKANYSR